MVLQTLESIRSAGPPRRTIGLPDDVIAGFAERDASLRDVVAEAGACHERYREEFPEILALDEPAQIQAIQRGFVNFYADSSVNPYVPLAAKGPWIVTCKGAVLHDSVAGFHCDQRTRLFEVAPSAPSPISRFISFSVQTAMMLPSAIGPHSNGAWSRWLLIVMSSGTLHVCDS